MTDDFCLGLFLAGGMGLPALLAAWHLRGLLIRALKEGGNAKG